MTIKQPGKYKNQKKIKLLKCQRQIIQMVKSNKISKQYKKCQQKNLKYICPAIQCQHFADFSSEQNPVQKQIQVQKKNIKGEISKMDPEYKDDSIQSHITQNYTILEKIGSGAYGHVWKVEHKLTKQIHALKKIYLAFQNDTDAQRTFREIAILKKLEHPNVVKLREVLRAQNDMDLYLLFEYVECDLFTAIKDGVLNEVHRKYVIFQLAKTVKYLHSAGILHRDLKPSNILVDSSCRIKICDFGLSRTLHHYEGKNPTMTEFIATRWYRAPEVLFGSTTYSTKSDMWSLGCLIYEIFAEKPLLPGDDSINQIEKLLEFKGFPSKEEMSALNVQKIDILLSHFQTKKKSRDKYYKSDWSVSLIELLNGLLRYDPRDRWSPDHILNCSFISQFHNYEDTPIAEKYIKVHPNDNVKQGKEFYKTLIEKLFVKKIQHKFKKGVLNSFHYRSLSNSRRNLTTTKRKTFKNSISLHNKNNYPNYWTSSTPIKINHTIRNSKNSILKKVGEQIVTRPENTSSPYKDRKKVIFANQKKHRVLKPSIRKQNIKQSGAKKHLKRKGILK